MNLKPFRSFLLLTFALVETGVAGAAGNPHVYCTANYNRVDPGSSWVSAGDSNGVLEFDLLKQPSGIYSGQAGYRFLIDQSSDRRLGLYGIQVRGIYREGDGVSLLFGALKYESLKPNAKSVVFSHFVASVGDTGRLETIGILGEKFLALVAGLPDPAQFDLKAAVASGKLVKDDLLNLSIDFCKVELK